MLSLSPDCRGDLQSASLEIGASGHVFYCHALPKASLFEECTSFFSSFSSCANTGILFLLKVVQKQSQTRVSSVFTRTLYFIYQWYLLNRQPGLLCTSQNFAQM
jgi:hypothetical protein